MSFFKTAFYSSDLKDDNGTYDERNKNATLSYTSNVSFAFPLEANLFFFLTINISNNYGVDVQVDIKVEYWSKAALEQVSIHKLENRYTTDPKYDIGIITPTTRPRDNPFDNIKFTIEVRIPTFRSTPPHVIKAFYTKLRNLHHDLHNMRPMNFHSVYFEASNRAIFAEVRGMLPLYRSQLYVNSK